MSCKLAELPAVLAAHNLPLSCQIDQAIIEPGIAALGVTPW